MLQPLMIEGVPHWEHQFPEEYWPFFEDFRNFLNLLWDHLGLPEPTRAQYEMAHRLQYGVDSYQAEHCDAEFLEARQNDPREDLIMCFRAAGKSYITSGYATWRLMRNPRDEKILVLSASSSKAKEFVAQTKGVIESLDICKWLLNGHRANGAYRRDMADQFDVSYSSLSQSYSVAARGIKGQITGSRATLIIPDDIETDANSKTVESRQKILNSVRSDFIPIAKTEHGKGDIIFLGTPQTEESIYRVLIKEMGFNPFVIPVRYPAVDKLKNYTMVRTETGETINLLAPYLQGLADDGKLKPHQPTDQRFSNQELVKLESKGRATFALQYMLDTTLSDAERYPLRQRDLVVFSLSPNKAPLTIQWGRDSDEKNIIKDVPNLGFSEDFLLRPLFVDKEWEPYDTKILFVDPSGRGSDETAWAILASLSGYLFLMGLGGHKGDPAEAMEMIAMDAKRFNVNAVEVEPNYGQGMWTTAFQPILQRVWPGGCGVREGEWARHQKEVRIIDTLEPVLASHRLIVDETIIRREATKEDHQYSFLYQLSHITKDRGFLPHDDRLDAVAAGVAFFIRTMGQDSTEVRQGVMEERMQQEIDDFVDHCFSVGQIQRRSKRMVGKRKADGTRDEVYMTQT